MRIWAKPFPSVVLYIPRASSFVIGPLCPGSSVVRLLCAGSFVIGPLCAGSFVIGRLRAGSFVIGPLRVSVLHQELRSAVWRTKRSI